MSDENLTPRQAHILSLIERYIETHDYPPTMEEIRKLARLNSTATVHQHVQALKRKGYLRSRDGLRRAMALEKRARGIPLVGEVAAGTPLEAVENIERYVEVPQAIFRKRPDYLLRVRGESMIEAGIRDGDWIAVRKADTADPGTIVIARHNNEVTVKELSIDRGEVVLIPHNPAMQPLRFPADEVSIVGIYAGGLIRPC